MKMAKGGGGVGNKSKIKTIGGEKIKEKSPKADAFGNNVHAKRRILPRDVVRTK
jgi:hypothetical protein